MKSNTVYANYRKGLKASDKERRKPLASPYCSVCMCGGYRMTTWSYEFYRCGLVISLTRFSLLTREKTYYQFKKIKVVSLRPVYIIPDTRDLGSAYNFLICLIFVYMENHVFLFRLTGTSRKAGWIFVHINVKSRDIPLTSIIKQVSGISPSTGVKWIKLRML